MLLFLFALLAGVVTIAGPCILPLLPIILGTSTARSHSARPLFIVLGFVLSFSLFAIIFAILGTYSPLSPNVFRVIATFVIGSFGLVMLFPRLQTMVFAKLEPLVNRAHPQTSTMQPKLWSGFLLGTSLGLVWTPCAGPILGSIVTLVAAKQNLAQAGALLVAYAFGAGIPMLLIAYGGQVATTRIRILSKYTPIIQRIFGALILLVAFSIGLGLDREIQVWLLTKAPWLFPNVSLNL